MIVFEDDQKYLDRAKKFLRNHWGELSLEDQRYNVQLIKYLKNKIKNKKLAINKISGQN